jgi:uncharacterized protein YukJ
MALSGYGVWPPGSSKAGPSETQTLRTTRSGRPAKALSSGWPSTCCPSRLHRSCCFVADEAFQHPLLQSLPSLPDGFTALPSQPGGFALDFIRGNLFDRQAMRPVPSTAPGPDNDLADKIDHFVSPGGGRSGRAALRVRTELGPRGRYPDKVFGFSPGNGVHDIHMNQGNAGRFVEDDGVWQDGGLLLHYPGHDQWVGIFLAFQSQVWHTDDTTGHTDPAFPTLGPAPQPAPGEPESRGCGSSAPLSTTGRPAPETETVTLLNASPTEVDLGGWFVLDRLKQRMVLAPQVLPAGEDHPNPAAATCATGQPRGTDLPARPRRAKGRRCRLYREPDRHGRLGPSSFKLATVGCICVGVRASSAVRRQSR